MGSTTFAANMETMRSSNVLLSASDLYHIQRQTSSCSSSPAAKHANNTLATKLKNDAEKAANETDFEDGFIEVSALTKRIKMNHSISNENNSANGTKSTTTISENSKPTNCSHKPSSLGKFRFFSLDEDETGEERRGFITNLIKSPRDRSQPQLDCGISRTLPFPRAPPKPNSPLHNTKSVLGGPNNSTSFRFRARKYHKSMKRRSSSTSQKSSGCDGEGLFSADRLFSWMQDTRNGALGLTCQSSQDSTTAQQVIVPRPDRLGPAPFLPRSQDSCEDRRVYNLDPSADNPRAVLLDVGGRRHKVLESNFNIYPNTRLGKLVRARTEEDILNLCDGFLDGDVPEYFFDRNWHSFNSILDIYRTGVLHLNTDMCALVMQKDLEYWQIDELILEPCCALKYYPEIEICVKEQKGEQESKRKEAQRLEDENFGSHIYGRIRTYLWNLMEYPETSKQAQAMAFTSLSVVIISTMTFILGTFPEFQSEEESGHQPEYYEAVLAMHIIDNITVGFFLIEYVIRLVCSPRKLQFFVAPMNLVDLFAIVPFFLDLIIGGLQDFQIMGKAGKIVRLVRVMRIMRIFKLVRHFAGLQSLIYTLNQAYKELGLLMLLVGVAVLTFSSLVYFAEKDNPQGPWSFLDSFWWGLMTLTTVGYGDLSPSTFPGKLIGGLCALGGVFILTLPIPIVVNSFASYYKNRLWRNEVAYKKRQRAKKEKRNGASDERQFIKYSYCARHPNPQE